MQDLRIGRVLPLGYGIQESACTPRVPPDDLVNGLGDRYVSKGVHHVIEILRYRDDGILVFTRTGKRADPISARR
jgi:hypothetical protein